MSNETFHWAINSPYHKAPKRPIYHTLQLPYKIHLYKKIIACTHFSVSTGLSQVGLPNWKEKVVGFGLEGASVMVGSRNGVVALLKADVPYLTDIHCLAHKLELGVLSALKDNPDISQVRDVLQGIRKCYKFSPQGPVRAAAGCRNPGGGYPPPHQPSRHQVAPSPQESPESFGCRIWPLACTL